MQGYSMFLKDLCILSLYLFVVSPENKNQLYESNKCIYRSMNPSEKQNYKEGAVGEE